MSEDKQCELDTRALELSAATQREVDIYAKQIEDHHRMCAIRWWAITFSAFGIIGFLLVKLFGW